MKNANMKIENLSKNIFAVTIIMVTLCSETFSQQWLPSGATESQLIYRSGQVLVGTTTSAYKMYVVSSADGAIFKACAPSGGINVTSSSAGTKMLSSNSGGVTKVLELSSNNSVLGVVIDRSNNVGIGTITPTVKLEVVGDMKVNGKVFLQNGWSIETPDYVFDEKYKLSDLTKVEKYVKQNKHLPEMPSAAEMNKNGVELANLNLTLLKKVEELTLYAINQNKRIAALEARLVKE